MYHKDEKQTAKTKTIIKNKNNNQKQKNWYFLHYNDQTLCTTSNQMLTNRWDSN